MLNVANRSCIRRLSLRALRANRTRNLVAVLAIAMTALLFTSLFTIALSFRQGGGFYHGGFKYLTEAQFNELKEDPGIQTWSLRRYLGMPTEVPFNKSHVEIGYSDENEAHWTFCDPIEGRLPAEGTDEAATDTPTRPPPTPACWSCWASSRNSGQSSPSPLRWTATRPPRPSPFAAGGSTTRPSSPTIS